MQNLFSLAKPVCAVWKLILNIIAHLLKSVAKTVGSY